MGPASAVATMPSMATTAPISFVDFISHVSSAIPMIPVIGAHVGAGKAGRTLTTSATCSAELECRKVLFGPEFTTIPVLGLTPIPESETECDPAGPTLASIVAAGSTLAPLRDVRSCTTNANCVCCVGNSRPTQGSSRGTFAPAGAYGKRRIFATGSAV